MQTSLLHPGATARLNAVETQLMLITNIGANTDCVIKDDAINKAGM